MNLPPICAAEVPLREWHYREGAQNLRCEKARKRRREEANNPKSEGVEKRRSRRERLCKDARRRGSPQRSAPSIAEISASRLSRCSASWLPQFFSASRSHVVASSRRRFVTSSRLRVAPFISCVSGGALKDRKTFFAITHPKLPKKAVVVS